MRVHLKMYGKKTNLKSFVLHCTNERDFFQSINAKTIRYIRYLLTCEAKFLVYDFLCHNLVVIAKLRRSWFLVETIRQKVKQKVHARAKRHLENCRVVLWLRTKSNNNTTELHRSWLFLCNTIYSFHISQSRER